MEGLALVAGLVALVCIGFGLAIRSAGGTARFKAKVAEKKTQGVQKYHEKKDAARDRMRRALGL